VNGDRSFGQPVPDTQLAQLMNVIYNVWFRKWKQRASHMTDDEFDLAVSEINHIMEQGKEYPIVKNLAITFLYELSARKNGGYTETERDKLLGVIQGWS
jgi:hypothetical protein